MVAAMSKLAVMTFDDIKRIAREVLEERLENEYGLHTGGSYGVEIDSADMAKILDGIAHDIAGRVTREAM